MAKDGRRLALLDELRGLMMILVMLYHLGYDLSAVFGLPMPWFWDWPVQTARDCMTGTLMVLSGISCSLSRSNLRRGIRTLALAMALTAVTFMAMPSERILFGVLHYYGACMLLWALADGRLPAVPVRTGVLIAAALFALTRFVPSGELLLPLAGRVPLPDALYQSRWAFWLGFPHAGFFSADYYPLIPWGFLFLAGGILGAHWKRDGFPTAFYRSRMPALAMVGRHTLALYIVHQPLLLAVLWVIFWFVR